MERIDKLLSHSLNITRSEARALLKKGGVRLNGKAVSSPAEKANEQSDCIEVNGEKLTFQKFVYIMMNKPPGVISSTDGRKTAEKTVIDILPPEMKRNGLFPAGRLDKDTVGFMLITDDGAFAHDILSPKKHISKTYIAELDKPFPCDAIEKFAKENNHKFKVVTLDGEILNPGGSLTGGSLKTSGNILSRKRLINDFEEKIQSIKIENEKHLENKQRVIESISNTKKEIEYTTNYYKK